MIKITQYENITNPKIQMTLTIDEVLNIIKNGNEFLPIINAAREYGKGHPLYNSLKSTSIPTFRYNFLFNERASNKTIISSTGLIYLDIDDNMFIPESELIYASWRSLSNTGYGLLVKVDNLTLDNFKYVYNEISDRIGVTPDDNARKATQQTVLSYDSDLYFNSDSTTYHYLNKEKVSSPNNIKKKKEWLSTNGTFIENTSNSKVRYNNIDDYFIDSDNVYVVFTEDKELICNPYLPLKVNVGRRNSILFIYFCQIVALNPTISKNYMRSLGESINTNIMKPKLSEKEMNAVIDSVFKKLKNDDLSIIYNQERRILFNPSIKLSHKEKMVIVNKELGLMKSEMTKAVIYEIIEGWDFNSSGKITQVKVCELSDFSLPTIKRYWHHFKAYIGDLNNDYKKHST
ncbi:hypothetical protein [uncultured Lutibacter sp.]|uniref:hypothetical protein n=1 Tax=uncultured Lutibacter sp. TaxID=437739 RepID=UPI0026198BA3|nr:hypothetical protein [uncultured Lutibacter sp.]